MYCTEHILNVVTDIHMFVAMYCSEVTYDEELVIFEGGNEDIRQHL